MTTVTARKGVAFHKKKAPPVRARLGHPRRVDGVGDQARASSLRSPSALYARPVVGLVWLASIVQTLADHGDNPRFLIPLQMFVFYMVASWMWQWKGTRTA